MAKEPESMILPLLREIRDEIQEVRHRLDRLESGQKTIRQALTDTMMLKSSPAISKSAFLSWNARLKR